MVDNVDHVAWFDPSTILEIAERCGLELVKYQGVLQTEHSQPLANFKEKIFQLIPLLCSIGVRPELFSKTIIYEFKLPSDP